MAFRRRALFLNVALALGASGTAACAGETVNLGRAPTGVAVDAERPEAPSAEVGGSDAAAEAGVDAEAGSDGPTVPQFGEPRLVAVVNTEHKEDNPTLTEGMLELYFSSDREGDSDVWVATRATVGEDFSEPERLAVISTSAFDSSPAVDPDGRTLWVGSRDADSGLDIWMTQRGTVDEPWSEPTLVVELNSDQDDLPRPTGNGGRSMPLASRRGQSSYQTFIAERPTPGDPFSEPRLLRELVRDDHAMGDAFITDDGRTLYFAYSREEMGDLFVAVRADAASSFGPAVELTSINTDFDERDPWLSKDGSQLYFSSDRDGEELDIYVAQLPKDPQ